MSTVIVSPYSQTWPLAFARIRADLLDVFTDARIDIQHIGSTSVPDLAAKPVIDVLLGADSLTIIEDKIGALERSGYRYVPKYERELPMRRYFVKAEGEHPRVHLHAVVSGSTIWNNHIAFRDALRANPSLRAAYQALKLDLAAAHADDKSAYTAAKSPFIQTALAALAAERDPGDSEPR
ncbi:MAG: GrpB family protein [Lysobacteraceae bacterium]|nr:MAG: GrpB family protein [Xanthomonadaceae bacterium]